MSQFMRQAHNQPLAALVRELEPLYSSMLMFTKVTSREAKDLLGDMEALRGYVGDLGRLLVRYKPMVRSCATAQRLVRLADTLDQIGAHAMADIVDEAARLVVAQENPQQQLAQQQQQKQQQQQLSDRLLNIHTEMLNATRAFSNPTGIPAAMKRLLDQVRELGFAANALKQSTQETATTAETVHEMVCLADSLDARGLRIQADLVDRVAGILDRLGGDEGDLPIAPGHKSSLSTRYCPDHNGVQAIRVAERVYQCPIDGRTYDYEGGYVNYSGQRIPGGSIAAQTPTTAPYALPQRLFDSRQNILNTIN